MYKWHALYDPFYSIMPGFPLFWSPKLVGYLGVKMYFIHSFKLSSKKMH
jgi:hypothetical protein